MKYLHRAILIVLIPVVLHLYINFTTYDKPAKYVYSTLDQYIFNNQYEYYLRFTIIMAILVYMHITLIIDRNYKFHINYIFFLHFFSLYCIIAQGYTLYYYPNDNAKNKFQICFATINFAYNIAKNN